MATIDLDVREQMKEHLADLVRTGKVSDPKDAHPLLKKKFGRSLTVGELYRVVKGQGAQGGAKKTDASPSKRKPQARTRKTMTKTAPAAAKPRGRPARPAAKRDDAAIRREMKAYLTEQVKAGKVAAPKDAHPLLKKKFGRSMSFGEVSTILGANRPGGPKPKRKRKAKADKQVKGANKAGKKRGRPGKAATRTNAAKPSGRGKRSVGSADYLILADSREPILAGNRTQAIDRVRALLERGADPAGIQLFQRVGMKVDYKVSL